jgi:hypothetical protein
VSKKSLPMIGNWGGLSHFRRGSGAVLGSAKSAPGRRYRPGARKEAGLNFLAFTNYGVRHDGNGSKGIETVIGVASSQAHIDQATIMD